MKSKFNKPDTVYPHGLKNTLKPSSLLCKLGSLIVHYEEAKNDPHPFDLKAIETLTNDPEVKEWIAAMNELGLLPVKRKQ